MARADVVVIGAGLSGLSAALALADAGATVQVLAKGHAATHWASGGLDVAAIPGIATPREAVQILGGMSHHPYAILRADLEPALTWLRLILADQGMRFVGDLDMPLRPVPTAIGGTRRVAILPEAQAQAHVEWTADSELVVCGPAGFKDFWPTAIAASLGRPEVWGGPDRPHPAHVRALTVELPGLAGRHNLNALELARRFDEPSWRADALEVIARGLDGLRLTAGQTRVALPAVFGLDDHVATFDAVRQSLPVEPFEVPLVPPSIPGMRLYGALRAALRQRGGRIQIGESVTRIDVEGRQVRRVVSPAAVRDFVVETDRVILATGGLAGGGLVGLADGRVVEPLLDLAVEAPPAERWLAADAFDASGHPLEAAGIRTDGELRPVGQDGGRSFDGVRVVGSLLAGQRYLRERCGDGVAVASGWRAARSLQTGAVQLAGAGGGTR